MTERVIDLSESPASLRIRDENLCVRTGEDTETAVPVRDIAAVVVSQRAVTFTQPVLASLAEAGAVFVVCDNRHLPVGMLMPLQGHYAQAQRFAAQSAATRPMCKRAWQEIIRAKIRAQAQTLHRIHGNEAGLTELAKSVRSGDPTNVEAQAARRYWKNLFGSAFRRDFDSPDQNRFLNYGYAVLRGVVARAICGAGLHPSVGIHHKHRNNAFCLADDLAEPYRPLVDERVWRLCDRRGADAPFDSQARAELVKIACARYNTDNERRGLFDIVSRLAASLAGVFEGRRRKLEVPPATPAAELPADGAEHDASRGF
ncbi:MAG: type II CRISPR-associated endonuclease Cas1 [Phycisphaerae bacterium]